MSADSSKYNLTQSRIDTQVVFTPLRITCMSKNYDHWTVKNCQEDVCSRGGWIAELYDTHLWTLLCCTMPWAVTLSLRLFSDPSKTSTLSSWFYLVYLICYYYLSANLTCDFWNRKLKINKIYLKKMFAHFTAWGDRPTLSQLQGALFCGTNSINTSGGNVSFLKKIGHPRPLFDFFSSFQSNIKILTINKCEKCYVHPVYGVGIRTHDLQNMSLLP